MAQYSDDPVYEFETKKKNPTRALLLLSLLAVSGFFMKSTLAANVSLSSGIPTEFGQGTLSATACDPSFQITPTKTFINHPVESWDYGSQYGVANAGDTALFTGPYLNWGDPFKYAGYEVEGAGIARGTRIISARGNTWTYIDFTQAFIGRVQAFNIIFPDRWAFTGISLSSLDSTALTGCVGKTLVVKAFGVSSTVPLATYSIVNSGGSFSSPDGTLSVSNLGTTNTSILLTFTNSSVNSDSVYRITVESRNT